MFFLEKRQENLFNERPINIQKSKAMLDKKYWDTMLYYSVHIMSDKIDFDVKTLSSTEVEIVMQMNNNNLLVPELKEFFESSRNL